MLCSVDFFGSYIVIPVPGVATPRGDGILVSQRHMKFGQVTGDAVLRRDYWILVSFWVSEFFPGV